MENRIRTRYLSNEERTIIEEKAKALGITVGEYIAYAAISGYVINYDFLIEYIDTLRDVKKHIYSLSVSLLNYEDSDSSDVEELLLEIKKINSNSNSLMKLIFNETSKINCVEAMKGAVLNEH